MRHVSRTHRVALHWLFDRINLDTKIQIKYIDTKNHLADKLTKGNFTRDEWNHLVCLFNISHFSSTVFWNNGETISTRFRRRTSHSKIEADDDFGFAMQRKGSQCACRGKPDMKVRTYLWTHSMSSNRELEDLWWAIVHQTTQNGILTKSGGLLKSWNLMKCWKQERRDPWVDNPPVRSLSTQTGLSLMTMVWTLTPPQNQTFRQCHGHSCTGWMIECEQCWTTQCKTVTNIL